jgi:hypothetical protein
MFNLNMFSDVSNRTKKVCGLTAVLLLGSIVYIHKDAVYRLLTNTVSKDSNNVEDNNFGDV